MFPFKRTFKVIGDPKFDSPLYRNPCFGIEIEDLARALEIRFDEIGLFPPSDKGKFEAGEKFVLRIFRPKGSNPETYEIEGTYLPYDCTLTYNSELQEDKASLLVDYLNREYLQIQVEEIKKLGPQEFTKLCDHMRDGIKDRLVHCSRAEATEIVDWIVQSWDSFIGVALSGLEGMFKSQDSTIAAPMRYQFLQPIMQNGSINPAIRYFEPESLARILKGLNVLSRKSQDEFLTLHVNIFEKFIKSWRKILFELLPAYYIGNRLVSSLQFQFQRLCLATGEFGLRDVEFQSQNWRAHYQKRYEEFCQGMAELASLQIDHDKAFIEKAYERAEFINSPLTRKYIAWGVKSADEIPPMLLKMRDGELPVELYKKNLKVRARTHDELLQALNANVQSYMDDVDKNLYDTMDDCYGNGCIANLNPIKVLLDDMNGLSSDLLPMYGKVDWSPLLAKVLSLPRHSLRYSYWCCSDEGPTEPGLQYELEDGSIVEVFCEVDQSKWDEQIRDVEDYVTSVIHEVEDRLRKSSNIAMLNEWADIAQMWDDCYDAHCFRHSKGNATQFASKFRKSLRKVCYLPGLFSSGSVVAPVGNDKSKHSRKPGVRAKDGELTQEDVAKDFGVSRKTVNKWEREQTVDGPNNKSNPYGYYRSLRIDPNLRGAYEQLAGMAKLYLRRKEEAKKKGQRFRMTFVRFNELMLEHNQKK